MSKVFGARWLICRICLKSENKKLYNIFGPIDEEDIADLGTTLLDKIELCGDIKLSQQCNFPNKICSRCVLLLRAAYKFRDLCQQSQNQLKQFILPQKDELRETIEINFDSDDDEQKNEVQEEVESGMLPVTDYVIESVVEYDDDTSYDPEENFDAKNEDFMASIEENVEIQDLSEDDNSKYVVEDNPLEVISDENLDEVTKFKYGEDSNGDDIIIDHIIEDHPTKTENQNLIKLLNEKKQAVRKKRKHSQIESNNGTYSCMFCVNTYTDKTKYNNHIKIHVKDKPHECEICKKRFSTTPQLSRHMNSHTGNRPYKCQYCEASFGDPSTKIKHERIHTNERPYKCYLCSKAFAYSNVLKVHMMTHTGEKPHTCDYCGRSFSQLHHKNAHEKRHKKGNIAFVKNSSDNEYVDEDELKGYKIEEII